MTFSNKTWHIIYNSCMVLLQDALDSILSSCLCELCPYVMCTSVCTYSHDAMVKPMDSHPTDLLLLPRLHIIK